MGNIDDTNDAVWYGLHNDDNDYNGWKEVLKEDQYKVVKTDDGSFAKIDLENHTIYTQVRWIVRYRTNTEESETVTISSDWSAPACVGKDAAKTGPLKPGDIDAQVISDLRYTGEQFNNYPVIGFMPTEDNKLTSQLAQVNGTQGGIFLETEARVSGKNDWVQLQGDFTIKTGEMTIALQNLAEAEGKIEKDTPIELRARYYCSQDGEGQEPFYSVYSEILTFGSQDMQAKPDDNPEASKEISSDLPKKGEDETPKCTLCGFCPHPLGICIFI